jgi:TPR repeat protein
MRKDIPGEASNRYGKLLTRLTGHTKTAKNGQNTGFLRLARPSQRRPRTWRWERKRGAALLSFSVCLFRAGILVNSRSGVLQDYAEAARWYRKAAEQGNAIAQTNLGTMYFQGQGVPQDYAEAVRWCNLAVLEILN